MSGNGQWVAFESLATNLVAADTNGTWDIFLRHTASGTTERVSIPNSGGEADGESIRPAISQDGRYVAFVSSASTSSQATTTAPAMRSCGTAGRAASDV